LVKALALKPQMIHSKNSVMKCGLALLNTATSIENVKGLCKKQSPYDLLSTF